MPKGSKKDKGDAEDDVEVGDELSIAGVDADAGISTSSPSGRNVASIPGGGNEGWLDEDILLASCSAGW